MLNSHRALLRFPLYGALATTLLAIVFLGPGLYLLGEDTVAGAIPLLILGVYGLTVVGLYFSVGLAATANMIFSGQEATVSDGLAVARERFSQICGWAVVSTAVSALMALLERFGLAGVIAARLVGTAWSLVTFVAVPVIAVEGSGPLDTLKRSGSIFRERWGQQITGNLAIGGLIVILGIFPAVVLITLGLTIWTSAAFLGALVTVIGVLVLVIALLISKALSGVFGVALYRYAVDGQAVGGFTSEEMESAVKTRKGGRNAPPTATPGTI